MGNLIYSMNVSLDGSVATPDHSLDWGPHGEELHTFFDDQARDAGAFLPARTPDVQINGRLLADAGQSHRDRPAPVSFCSPTRLVTG